MYVTKSSEINMNYCGLYGPTKNFLNFTYRVLKISWKNLYNEAGGATLQLDLQV